MDKTVSKLFLFRDLKENSRKYESPKVTSLQAHYKLKPHGKLKRSVQRQLYTTEHTDKLFH